MSKRQEFPSALVALPACRKETEGQGYHTIGDKYVRAAAEAAGCLPVTVPALAGLIDVADLVARLDGLILTGSPSNVHPEAYGGDEIEKAEPFDIERDAVTLPLIREALAQGLPLFAICRGMQELNVALGGTLFARLHELEGRDDHRRPRGDLDTQYGPKHKVRIREGGVLHALLGTTEIEVNSLHNQGIARLAPGLTIEAEAGDGTIEAVSLPESGSFVLGVQWHPEWKAMESPEKRLLFEAFGAAARARAAARHGVAPALEQEGMRAGRPRV